jgi:hypothetical protein
MGSRTVIIILAQVVTLYWWAVLVYSRHQTAKKRAVEEAKYAVWDTAYKQAVKAGKTEYFALMDAVKAVNGSPAVLRVWDDTYNKAIADGVRRYKAGVIATAAAREAAHKK